MSGRFNKDKLWYRVLFRPDKKSQTEEIEELQCVINQITTNNFSYIYSYYSLINPIRLNLIGFTSTSYKLAMSAGQIYIENMHGGFFIDIKPEEFEVPLSSRTYIGVKFIYDIANSNEYRDPLTGGFAFGDIGSDRLVFDYDITFNDDAYPIAVVEGRGGTNLPSIYYYTPEGYSIQNDRDNISKLVLDYVSLRWKEESGDFIAEGLNIQLSSNYTITISPGYAYIEGRQVFLDNPFSYALPRILSVNFNKRIVLSLTNNGLINVSLFNTDDYTIPDRSILLGVLLIDPSTRLYKLIDSDNRAVSVEDIRLISQYNILNERRLQELLLERASINEALNEDIDLSGIITDSFNSLNKSDIYHPLYTASIIPSENTLRGGFKANTINFSNLEISNNSGIVITYRSGIPYYLTPALSDRTLVSQAIASSWITINPTTNKAVMNIVPNSGMVDTSSNTYNKLIFKSSDEDKTITPKLVLQSVLIKVQAYGFPSYSDNIELTFGNVRITEFTPTNNTSLGSQSSTLKAKADGSVSVEFRVPNNLEATSYVVTLSNQASSCSHLFKFNNDSISYINNEFSNNSIAQTFTIETPLVIRGVRVAFRRVPSITSNDYVLGIVSINKTKAGFPTNEVISQGYVFLSDVSTSSNGTNLTTIFLDTPAVLETSGQYAVVYNSLTNVEVELYKASISETPINGNSAINIQPLIGGELVIRENDVWQKQTNSDLTFELIQSIPSNTKSSLTFTLSNPLEIINSLNYNLSHITPPNTSIKLVVNNQTISSPFFLNEGSNEIDMNLELVSTSSLFPVIYLPNSNITTESNLSTSTWISRTISVDASYRNIEVSFDYYRPVGTDIKVFFSSNNTQTWEVLQPEEELGLPENLIDGNIPLYRGRFIGENLSSTVDLIDLNNNINQISRQKLTIRIDLITEDPNVQPYIKKLSSIVY